MTSITAPSKEHLREIRIGAALTQSALAHRAGISRQALNAIESGVYQPNVTVALKLARELGRTVEDLFGSPEQDVAHRVEVRWIDDRQAVGAAATRVVLGRVGARVVAVTQPAVRMALAPVAGLVARSSKTRAEISTFRSQDEIDSTLLIAGCDPAVAMLSDWLARRRSPVCAVAIPCSSSSALDALINGRAHAAGTHLRDPKTGRFNLRAVDSAMGRRRHLIVNFARWELGLATASGNPLKIRGFADLSRPRLRLANRERGSGARAALDEAIAELGLHADRIIGYDAELAGHLEVAGSIAAGQADVGVSIRVAADASGLNFVPLREESYDLVIPETESDSPPVKAMLDALNSRRFAREVSQFCAYDTSQMGQVTSRLNSL